MLEINNDLRFVLVAFALVWLGLTIYVLLARIVHSAVTLVARRVQEAVLAPENERRRGRLLRSALERMAADAETPPEVATRISDYLVRRYGASIIARARSGRRRWKRVQALRILARAGADAAVPLLEEALQSDDEALVASAVAALGGLGDRSASEVLVRGLRGNRFARSRLAAHLNETSAPIDDLLLPLLAEEEPQLRFWAATLLSRYAGSPSVASELVRAVGDVDPSVRAAAVESLAAGSSPAAPAAAALLLGDPVWFVRAHAARALRDVDLDTAHIVAPLLADESWWVRAAAKETLAARPAAARAVLLDYLDHPDAFARNGAAEVLQNLGILDELLAGGVEVEAHGDRPSPALRILAAGGPRLRRAAALRNGLDVEELERLASR